MGESLRPIAQAVLRQTDSNTLLRMYDAAQGVLKQSSSPRDRERATRIVERIGKELHKRNVAR